MSNAQIEIQAIAALVAIACAVPGVFLVLRKMALISDAISHSILPGIVIGFFITQDLSSPLNIFLAAVSGIITVILVEYIQKTGLVKEDTAIGLVFPALFSIGVILIARNANDVHLDVDAVLLGEIAFAPFDRWNWKGTDLGPKAIWIIGTITFVTVSLVILFFKELKASTFDPGLAASLGFAPAILHYGLMSVSSITIVGAFDAVGAVLVVAFIIAPAATAYLLTTNLIRMLILSCGIGVLAAISGYWIAHGLDASIAGSIATVLGLFFFLAFMLAPERGVLAALYRTRQQKMEVALLTFLLHLNNHTEVREREVRHLSEHINWKPTVAKRVLILAQKNNMVTITNGVASLTKKGKTFSEAAVDYITLNKNTEIESIKEEFFLFRG